MKPAHSSKPPPPPAFKPPPSPPPGAPPSAGQPPLTSPAAKSPGTSVPPPERRRNAWALPLANHGPCQGGANPDSSPGQAPHIQSAASSSEHMLSCESASHGRGSSCNASNTVGTRCDADPVSAGGQQGNVGEGLSSSPRQVTPAQSCTAAAAAVGLQGASQGGDQYPREAQHKVQIADLQARSAVNFCLFMCPCLSVKPVSCIVFLWLLSRKLSI